MDMSAAGADRSTSSKRFSTDERKKPAPAASVFLKNAKGEIFHTYSAFGPLLPLIEPNNQGD